MPLGVPSRTHATAAILRLTNSRPCQFNACLTRTASGESPGQYIIIQLGRPSLTLGGNQVRHEMPPKAGPSAAAPLPPGAYNPDAPNPWATVHEATSDPLHRHDPTEPHTQKPRPGSARPFRLPRARVRHSRAEGPVMC